MQEVEGILKWVLTSAVTGLSFIMVYFFNQTQALGRRISENEKAIALNDQHDNTTDSAIMELKSMIIALGVKIDELIKKK